MQRRALCLGCGGLFFIPARAACFLRALLLDLRAFRLGRRCLPVIAMLTPLLFIFLLLCHLFLCHALACQMTMTATGLRRIVSRGGMANHAARGDRSLAGLEAGHYITDN
ncbi:MAG TPA: hypothetical protein VGG36_01220 [Rhizomicrobium sp.]